MGGKERGRSQSLLCSIDPPPALLVSPHSVHLETKLLLSPALQPPPTPGTAQHAARSHEVIERLITADRNQIEMFPVCAFGLSSWWGVWGGGGGISASLMGDVVHSWTLGFSQLCNL